MSECVRVCVQKSHDCMGLFVHKREREPEI